MIYKRGEIGEIGEKISRISLISPKIIGGFMSAPKGNKFAKGNQGGRPTNWIPELVSEMSKRLLTWAEQDSALIFPQFCIQEKLTMRQFYYLKESYEEFAEAFSYAKALLACRLISKTGKDKEVHPALSLRYIKYYDEFLLKFEREEKQIGDLSFVIPHYEESNTIPVMEIQGIDT
jgi:hypothetical protein